MITETKAREIARSLVDPNEADDNKIALFGATGEIEAGVADGVEQAKDYAIEHKLNEVSDLEDLAAFLYQQENVRNGVVK